MKKVTSPPAAQLYKVCYLVHDMALESKLLERFRYADNAHEFAARMTSELGRKCLVREASVSSNVKLVDEL